MGRLDGKVAVITGSGSGMGRVEAILFAKEGAKVAVVDILPEKGEETVKLVKEAGGEAIFIKTDVAKSADVKKMVDAIVKAYGKLNIMVNGAAIAPSEGSTVELSEEIFDKTIAINLKGVWLGMKYAIPAMIKSGGGAIVNFASISGVRALPTIPSYLSLIHISEPTRPY